MKTREFVEQEIEKFEKLSLEEKLSKLYEEHLLERYSQQIEIEEIPSPEYSDDELDKIQQELLGDRIENLIFTSQETLLLAKATGIWDILIKKFGSNRSASLILNLLSDQNTQVLQNKLSQSPSQGLKASDFSLSQKEAEEFFAKLESIQNPPLPAFVLRFFQEWNNTNQRV